MKRKGCSLTVRGKQTLIVVLTALGCAIGVITAMVISLLCMGKEQNSYVLACENQRVSDGGVDDTEFYSARQAFMVEPQWLFYQSCSGDDCRGEEKSYMDQLVNRWTKGRLTDDELSEQLGNYLLKKNVGITSVGVQSKMLCLFPSANDLPDYTAMMEMADGLYSFTGIYTDGEMDENGRLICYYWEVGVK